MASSSSEHEDWSFIDDSLVMKAIDDAVRRYVALFENAIREDAIQLAVLYVAERPHIVERARDGDDYGSLYWDIYSHALRQEHIRDRDIDVELYEDHAMELDCMGEDALALLSPDTGAVGSAINEAYYFGLCETDEERRKVQDVIDRFVIKGGDTYTEERVRQLVALCFAPSMLDCWKDPYGARRVDPNASRKAKGDPSHRFTEVAELADMHRAWERALLPLEQRRVLFVRFMLDLTERAASDLLGIPRTTMQRLEASAIKTLTALINGAESEESIDLPT